MHGWSRRRRCAERSEGPRPRASEECSRSSCTRPRAGPSDSPTGRPPLDWNRGSVVFFVAAHQRCDERRAPHRMRRGCLVRGGLYAKHNAGRDALPSSRQVVRAHCEGDGCDAEDAWGDASRRKARDDVERAAARNRVCGANDGGATEARGPGDQRCVPSCE